MTTLGLDTEQLNRCVQCGLCLTSCPTFRITGDESQSPRGRIALMRAVEYDGAPLSAPVRRSFETCVQCRSCETACPSGVPFGHLMSQTRSVLTQLPHAPARRARAAFAVLGHPALVRTAARGVAVAQRLRLVPSSMELPRLPLRQAALRPTGDDVHLFTGCVMDACQRDVHRDTLAVLGAVGVGASPTGDRVPCCGALHTHAGLSPAARRLATAAVRALDDGRPILVNSAGCGAMMKDFGELLGTEAARDVAERVFDISEWLAPRLTSLHRVPPLDLRVAVQDPCHLRHVQRVHLATRAVLGPFVRELVELDDDGLCCGAGGAYAYFEPEQARAIRARKLGAIERAAPDLVASANPGCSMHLAAAGVVAVHPMTLVARALRGATGATQAAGRRVLGGV